MEYKQKEEESSGDLKMLKRILKGAFGLAATGRSVGRSSVHRDRYVDEWELRALWNGVIIICLMEAKWIKSFFAAIVFATADQILSSQTFLI